MMAAPSSAISAWPLWNFNPAFFRGFQDADLLRVLFHDTLVTLGASKHDVSLSFDFRPSLALSK